MAWIKGVLMMCAASKSSNRERAPGALAGSIFEGRVWRHLTAPM